jgi:acyl-CoA reductase-like NAD-dependent aldehyde dehydrogenase
MEVYAAMDTRLDLRRKIQEAFQAKRAVRRLSLEERLARIRRSAEKIALARDSLLELLVQEGDFVRKFAEWQVDQVIKAGKEFASILDLIRPRRIGSERDLLRFEPYGVVGIVSPSNAPLIVPFYTLASSLGGGNAAVLRASGAAPVTARRVVDLIAPEWPEGAVQLTNCPGPLTADEFIESQDVDVILIYAGTAVGKDYLIRLGAHLASTRTREVGTTRIQGRIKKYVPELAGNDPFIVLPGANLDAAADAAVLGAFCNSGQTCAAAKRLLVHRAVSAEFMPRFHQRLEKLKVGDVRDPDTDIGPIGKSAGVQLAVEQLRDAVERGGTILFGGHHEGPIFHPTVVSFTKEIVLADDKPLLWNEECFAPVRSLVVFDTVEDALVLAADSPHALGASLWGDEESCLGLAAELDTGRVVINEHPFHDAFHLPFGGVRDSGMYGATHKIEEVTYAKLVHVGGAGSS